MQAIESRAEEIYTSDGIKIIHTSPESGRVSIAVERPHSQIFHTEPVLLAYLQHYRQQTLGEKLCMGIREEDPAVSIEQVAQGANEIELKQTSTP